MKLAVIIPTFNSEKTITGTLDSLLNQTVKIDEIVIIDNCSTDKGVIIAIEKLPYVTLIQNLSNYGAAGGYCIGLEYAYKKKFDWVWLIDADSYPAIDAFEELLKFIYDSGPKNDIGAVASLLIDIQSNLIYQPLYWRNKWVEAIESISMDPVSVDCVAFSGLLVNKNVIEKIGYPRKDFFMDIADWEYCLRIRNQYKIFTIPKSKVFHSVGNGKVVHFFYRKKLKKLEEDKIKIYLDRKILLISHSSWRYYYRVRNDIYVSFHEFRSLSAMFFASIRYLKICMGVVIYEDKKINKLINCLLGLIHGINGRLGIIVKPEVK
jgi:rhamnopyranosyl-N-acetylglucosaminyl-diphospho-decaprenol beta-1,3/1,4-galactofuranosyltransferase